MKRVSVVVLGFFLLLSSSVYGIELRDGVELGGSLQTEMRWQKYKDPASSEDDSTSDIYLRRVELGLETSLPAWLHTSIVLNSEWIGDDINDNDSKIVVDEAVMRIQKEGVPGYFEAGKRTQDFGLFENHLLTDPLTQDLYETKTVGFTLGYEKPLYDLSATVYDSEEMISHLVDSGLIGGLERDITGSEYSDDTGSYIIAFKAYSNKRQNILYVSYLSEPGPERNETITGGLGLSYSRVRLFGEYFKALKRERFKGLADEHKESAYSIGLAYGMVSPGTGAPQKIVFRYEHLDDDNMAKALGTYSLKDRYSAGIIAGLLRDRATGVESSIGLEYRYSKYRTYQPMKDTNQEVYLRVSVDF